MREFPFERRAMQGEPLPERLDIADSCLYVALKNLFNIRLDVITLETEGT